MKRLLFFAALAFFAVTAFSQEEEEKQFKINALDLEVRADFDNYNVDGVNSSGFSGKYLNFILKGNITNTLSYVYRQRLNVKDIKSFNSFFDGTDYFYMQWQPCRNFAISAGKEVIAMGGIEYDQAPIDIYFNSQFWNNMPCYELGVNAMLMTNDQKNTFTFQFTNSPLAYGKVLSGLYNYSVHWRGTYKSLEPVCSFNMYEYDKGKFLQVMALSMKFDFGRLNGYVDFANRATAQQSRYFFSDITTVAAVGYKFWKNIKTNLDMMQVYIKSGIDINNNQDITVPVDKIYDNCILPGTNVKYCGIGLEYFPNKGNANVRIHSFFAINDARSLTSIVPADPDSGQGAYLDVQNNIMTCRFNVGVTWRVNFVRK